MRVPCPARERALSRSHRRVYSQSLADLQGPAIQLKKFHNDVKRELIKSYAGRARRVLDLACGRGGDLHKWTDAGIKHVVGVDLSPKEIEEAKRRFRELRGKPLAADFLQSDALGLSSPILFGPHKSSEAFDAVTCVSIAAPYLSSLFDPA